MDSILEKAKLLYDLKDCTFRKVKGHEGGRNTVYTVLRGGVKTYVLRVSALGDRTEEEYLAECEFVHYLAQNGAPVADVIFSDRQNAVERAEEDGKPIFLSLFAYAEGMLISDNGYRYREGAPLEEYFYNTGKALGRIHRLSKTFVPTHRRISYFDKYNPQRIGRLIPDEYETLKEAIFKRLNEFKDLPTDRENFGLVHFDFSDGNYHVDMQNGKITAFDFDNSLYCWYLFDLANLWTHGVGWCMREENPSKRMAFMTHYFDTVLKGYESDTKADSSLLDRLPLFIDMVLIENIVDEFECSAREGRTVDFDDVKDAADCLTRGIPYAGVGEE